MKTHNLAQGSPEWLAFRREHFNASDAPAMLGLSPFKTRAELLKELATGIAPEIDAATQARFDRGHALEAAARPAAEEEIGDELFPAVGTSDEWEKLAASFDGATMDESAIWEHKTLNRRILEAQALPEDYMAQVQHQLIVSGAKSCLFTATDGEGGQKSWTDIKPDHTWHKRLIGGWRQFEKDLESWKPEAAAPEPEGRAPEALPALRIEIMGAVTASNLDHFRSRALALVGAVNTQLSTDQDFADAERSIKWCKEAETRLAAAKDAALAQTADIDRLFKTVNDVSEAFRQTRLTLEKSVKARKESVRSEIVMAALDAFREHLKAPCAEFLKYGLTFILPQPAFGEAINGLKTLASVKAAVDACLANARIEIAKKEREWRDKLAWLDEDPAREAFRSALHLPELIDKPIEDFKNAVNTRIAEIRQAEERRLEAERERIRQEEARKLEAKAAGERHLEAVRVREEAVKNAEESRTTAPRLEPTPYIHIQDEFGDLIRDFLKARDFGRDEHKIRAALVEFVKFAHQTLSGSK